MTNDYLTQKPPMRALTVFVLPIIIGNLFQQFYTMVDSAIVGRFVSQEALAAIGACYALTNVFIWVAVGGGIGASVVVSRYFGAKDYGRMKRAACTALFSFLAVSIVLGIIGLAFGRPLMQVLRTPEDVMGPAMTYLNIYFLGLPFLFMYNALSSMFNALGKSRIPLFFLIFSSVFNCLLYLLLVAVPLHGLLPFGKPRQEHFARYPRCDCRVVAQSQHMVPLQQPEEAPPLTGLHMSHVGLLSCQCCPQKVVYQLPLSHL